MHGTSGSEAASGIFPGDLSPPYISNGALTIKKRRDTKKLTVVAGESNCSTWVGESRILKMIKRTTMTSESESFLGNNESNHGQLFLDGESSVNTDLPSREQHSRNVTTLGCDQISVGDFQSSQVLQRGRGHSSESDIGMQPLPVSSARSSVEDSAASSIERSDDLQRKISTSRKLFKRAKDGLGSLRLKNRKPSKSALADAEPQGFEDLFKGSVSNKGCGQSEMRSPKSRASTDRSWSVVSRKNASETQIPLEPTKLFRRTPKLHENTIPYVLAPEISIFPEVDSINSDKNCLLRVAIKITGALKPAFPALHQQNEKDSSSILMPPAHGEWNMCFGLDTCADEASENVKYGIMHNFDITCFDMLDIPVEHTILPKQPV